MLWIWRGKDGFEGESNKYVDDCVDDCYEEEVSSITNCTLEGTTLSRNYKISITPAF